MFPFRSLPPSFRFALFFSMRYFCPFVPCLMFRSLFLPIRFNSSFPFIASFLSFHRFPTLRYFRPLVSSLISRSFPAVCSVLPSDLIFPVSSQFFLSVRYILSFISSLLFHLLLPFFRINSYVLFVSFFLPFQLFPFYSLRLRLRLSFVSIFLFHLLLPFFSHPECPRPCLFLFCPRRLDLFEAEMQGCSNSPSYELRGRCESCDPLSQCVKEVDLVQGTQRCPHCSFVVVGWCWTVLGVARWPPSDL